MGRYDIELVRPGHCFVVCGGCPVGYIVSSTEKGPHGKKIPIFTGYVGTVKHDGWVFIEKNFSCVIRKIIWAHEKYGEFPWGLYGEKARIYLRESLGVCR